MSFLKGCAKVVGSVALGAAGIASGILRTCASGAGMDEVADVIGSIQDKSFNTIEDMWTDDANKTEAYYEAQAEKNQSRAESAMRSGEQKRREYERMKEKAGRS